MAPRCLDANEEYLLYQTLSAPGHWKPWMTRRHSLLDRIERYMEKALKEAKRPYQLDQSQRSV